MPNFRAISPSTHGQLRWLRTTSFSFALRDGILPLGMAEVAKATLSLPLAFVQREGPTFLPVAVMSLQENCNHFVAPDGRWPHGYIPAATRAYPFRLFAGPDDQHILAIDEDSGLLSNGPEGETFFDESGSPSAAITTVMQFLEAHEVGLRAAKDAAALLAKNGLLKPWDISVKRESGTQRIAGLFQIDPLALAQLSGDALATLNAAGGLFLANCQLLSMQHLSLLGELASIHAQAERRAAEAKPLASNNSLDLEFLKSGETLNFGGFR